MYVALDSSLLVGLLVPNDVWHSQAINLWEAIKTAGHTSVYFDCVAAEAISVATRRLYEKQLLHEVRPMLEHLDARVPTNVITWVYPDVPRLYADVLELMRASSGELNFNDALIALVCRERDIPAIASFDADFDQVSWVRRLSVPEDV